MQDEIFTEEEKKTLREFLMKVTMEKLEEFINSAGSIDELWKMCETKKRCTENNNFVESAEDRKLNKKVTDFIHKIGIKEAILISLKDNEFMYALTKKLYPEIAKKYNTTPSRIERTIRHAIEIAYSKGNKELLDELFSYEKPTNSQFIAIVTEKIKMNQV